MKLFVTSVITIATILQCYSQKTKSYHLSKLQFASIVEYIKYDKLNNPVDTSYTFYGKDSRYTQLYEMVTLKSGSLQTIYNLVKKCSVFLHEEESGTSSNYDSTHIYVGSTMGVKYISISSQEKYNEGYTELNGVQLKKLISNIEQYCIEKRIPIRVNAYKKVE